MKPLLALLLFMLSLSTYSHCGTCGEGTASDHEATGEDSTHHQYDNMAIKKKKQDDDVSQDEEQQDGETESIDE